MNFARRLGRARMGRGHGSRRGFTLIELAIAMSLMMVGIVAVVSATSRMHTLRKLNRERTIAQNAMRSVAERIHSRSHALGEDPETWVANLLGVYGPGGSAGNTFDVEGLTASPGTPAVGTIQIVTDETRSDDFWGFELGMPRDLNGDGDTADADVTLDARILPVLLTVQWTGQSGQITLRHAFYVLGY